MSVFASIDNGLHGSMGLAQRGCLRSTGGLTRKQRLKSADPQDLVVNEPRSPTM